MKATCSRVLVVSLLLITSAGMAVAPEPLPQIGVNMIQFFMDPTGNCCAPYYMPDWIFPDFAELGVQAYRHLGFAELYWDNVEPVNNVWEFDRADEVLSNPDFEPIVTVFSGKCASPTPHWITSPRGFERTLGNEAKEYLREVIDRYGDRVKYWEIGNEMESCWRGADPGETRNQGLPPHAPDDGFNPQEQGAFLAETAAFIREHDPDAVIVMPGMTGLSEYILDTWLPGVIEGGGGIWFDVVNYHYYHPWDEFLEDRRKLETCLRDLGLDGMPVWLTETGSTGSETLIKRTNYPNSYITQAADVFRRIIQAYSMGDSLVLWHTYIGSADKESNLWRVYGLRSDTADIHLSYYTFQLLVQELIPFEVVEMRQSDPEGINEYRVITRGQGDRHVAWGEGTYTIPPRVSQMTSVIPAQDGSFSWEEVRPGDTVDLAPEPLLLK